MADLCDTNHSRLDVSSAQWTSGVFGSGGGSLPIIRAFQASAVVAIQQSNEVVIMESLEANGAVGFVGDVNSIHVFEALNAQSANSIVMIDSDVVIPVLEELTRHVADCAPIAFGPFRPL